MLTVPCDIQQGVEVCITCFQKNVMIAESKRHIYI